MVSRYLIAIIVVWSLVLPAWAQPVLNFKRIDATNFPEISLTFKVTCNGRFDNTVGPQNFEVYENGLPMGTFTMECPPDPDCCISAALVLDRSHSMTELDKMANVKIGAHAFIDQLGSGGYTCDEAAIVSFNEVVELHRPMTKNKFQLNQGIDELIPAGKTACWDAAMMGIRHIDTTAHNYCKAVILLSDGIDNSSGVGVDDVLAEALAKGVKVFTIWYGDDYFVEARQKMRLLAEESGGIYFYSPEPTSIISIFETIRETIRDSYQECTIKYVTDCPDGRNRIVDLKLIDFCGGSDAKTLSYIAPKNTSEWSPIEATVGSGTVKATELLEIPVTITNDVEGLFAESNFQINYNINYLTLDHAEINGTLLEGVAVDVFQTGSGVRVSTYDKFYIKGPGTLIRLYFKAADIANAVTNEQFYFANWNFDGYCLIPKMTHGTYSIEPRKAVLECIATSPAALKWDDFNKEYQPNPFEVSINVSNLGTREAQNAYGIIKYDDTKLTLITPAVDKQDFQPGNIDPGKSGTLRWVMRAGQLEEAEELEVCIEVYSDNHEPIQCCRTILVNPATLSSLVCDLNAPDTVYFREQYYEPETFDVNLWAKNTGNGLSRAVIGQLLQDTRFTKLTNTWQVLSDQFMPNDTAAATFTVQMIPRDTDGYDTLWAQVQGSDSDPAWCYKPVWVQRVRSPEFSLLCTTPEDVLSFDETTGEYVPNPFTVTTVAENIGETYAEECQVIFIGPQRFTPSGGQNIRSIGRMNIGDIDQQQWTLTALPQSTGGWDTLHFQIRGKGGLGRKIVLADCYLPIYVPEMRRPFYEITCTAPDSLQWDGIAYSPNPFTYEITITNTGSAPGYDINPRISMPTYLTLTSGTASQHIDELLPGASRTLQWTVECDKRLTQDYATICVSISDSGAVSNQCCTEVFVPAVNFPDLALTCISIDSLYVDPTSGEYIGNPFDVHATVVNNGAGIAVNAAVTISINGTHIALLEPPPITQPLGNIQPGAQKDVTWRIQAQKRPDNALIPIAVTLTADETSPITCDREVFIPSFETPVLASQCWSAPEDSLFFDWETGDFEYPTFEVGIEVENIGFLRAENVSVLLIPPDGISVVEGEVNEKFLGDALLEYGEKETLTWQVRAARDREDRERVFRFVVRADNAGESHCEDPLWVQGSPKVLTLTLPRDLLYRFGQKIWIPVDIGRTIGKDLSSYTFELTFDPSVLSILNVAGAGTLTEIGWVGPKLRHLAPGRVEISDYTTGTPLHTEPGTLVNIYTEGVFQRIDRVDDFGYSDLVIDSTTVSLSYGDIEPVLKNGSVYVTNECIEPLTATEGYGLGQNRPNPFNPTTDITFTLPEDSYVRIRVFDKMGRSAGTAAEGTFEAGVYTVTFDAKGLPSGLYFYMMEAGGATRVRKMILAR